MTIIVRINKYGDDVIHGIFVEIYPHTRRQHIPRVSVYKDRHFSSGRWRKAEVNWPACGVQPPKKTKEFGAALVIGAKLAEWLDSYVTHSPIRKKDIAEEAARLKRLQLGWKG